MEKELQKEIVSYLKEKGYFVWAIYPPQRTRMVFGSKQYMPDLHIVDLNLFLELKAPNYKSAHPERQIKQEIVREQLIEHGAKAYKITSLDELKEILNCYKAE